MKSSRKMGARYPEEFRSEAVRLSQERGVTVISQELDISPSALVRWRRDCGVSKTRASKKAAASPEDEMTLAKALKLYHEEKAENENLRKVIHILKKSTAIMSEDYKKHI